MVVDMSPVYCAHRFGHHCDVQLGHSWGVHEIHPLGVCIPYPTILFPSSAWGHTAATGRVSGPRALGTAHVRLRCIIEGWGISMVIRNASAVL